MEDGYAGQGEQKSSKHVVVAFALASRAQRRTKWTICVSAWSVMMHRPSLTCSGESVMMEIDGAWILNGPGFAFTFRSGNHQYCTRLFGVCTGHVAPSFHLREMHRLSLPPLP